MPSCALITLFPPPPPPIPPPPIPPPPPPTAFALKPIPPLAVTSPVPSLPLCAVFFAAPPILVQFPLPLLIWTAGVGGENPRTTSDDRSDGEMADRAHFAELAVGASASICRHYLSRVAVGLEMENLWRPRRSLPPSQQPLQDSLTCPRTSSYRSDPRG